MSKFGFKTEGLVLRRRPFRETSFLCTVLSPDLGVISVLCKAVRKEDNKFHGLISTFSNLEFTLHKKETASMYTLIDAILIDKLSYEKSFRKTVVQQAVTEIIQHIYIDDHENPHVYRLIISFFIFLNEVHSNEILVFLRFAFRLFEYLGTPIDLNLQLDPTNQRFYLEPQIEEEDTEYEKHNHRNIKIEKQTVEILLNIFSIGKIIDEIRLERQHVQDITYILEEYLNTVFHTKFKFKTLEMYPL